MQTTPKSRWLLVTWLILSQLATVGTMFFWLFLVGMSIMIVAGDPGTPAYIMVGLLWAYPLFPLAMAIGAWIAFAKRRNTLSAILTSFTFLPLLCLYLFIYLANATYPFFNP